MTALIAIFFAGLVVVVVVGLVLVSRTPAADVGPGPVTPLGRLRERTAARLGPYAGAVAIVVTGFAVAWLISWPFGLLVKHLKPHIDGPFLRWTQHHARLHGVWHQLNAVYTKMGNRTEIKVVDVVVLVVFAVLWARLRRAWWIPIVIVVAGFGLEHYGQLWLKLAVARPHVALPAFGSYPSGGCARSIVTYGLLWELVLLTWPQLSRRWRIAGWTLVAAAVFAEGYTRVYLIKHWSMDVVGGWLFGALLLLGLVATLRALAARREAGAAAPA